MPLKIDCDEQCNKMKFEIKNGKVWVNESCPNLELELNRDKTTETI